MRFPFKWGLRVPSGWSSGGHLLFYDALADFAFLPSLDEAREAVRSRSQSVILSWGANFKYAPLAFTEHGAVMAASVLNSPKAVEMSVFVVRAFRRLRSLVAGQRELAAQPMHYHQQVDALASFHAHYR